MNLKFHSNLETSSVYGESGAITKRNSFFSLHPFSVKFFILTAELYNKINLVDIIPRFGIFRKILDQKCVKLQKRYILT